MSDNGFGVGKCRAASASRITGPSSGSLRYAGVVAGIVVGVLLLTVASRLFYLQVLRHDYYAELSQGNRVRTDPIPPSRGLILDRHGVVLAENLPAFQLELVREQVGGLPAARCHLGAAASPSDCSMPKTLPQHQAHHPLASRL